jgi:hypothetical protein
MSRYVRNHQDCEGCGRITHFNDFPSCRLCDTTSVFCDDCESRTENFVYELKPKEIGTDLSRYYFCLGCLERHHHTKKKDIDVLDDDICRRRHGGTVQFKFSDRTGCLCCIQKDKSEYDYWIELINRQYEFKIAAPAAAATEIATPAAIETIIENINKMPLFKNSEKYKKHYGEITRVDILFYYKYNFTLRLHLKSGQRITIYTGGDSDDIYRYEPLSADWREHCGAEINKIID